MSKIPEHPHFISREVTVFWETASGFQKSCLSHPMDRAGSRKQPAETACGHHGDCGRFVGGFDSDRKDG